MLTRASGPSRPWGWRTLPYALRCRHLSMYNGEQNPWGTHSPGEGEAEFSGPERSPCTSCPGSFLQDVQGKTPTTLGRCPLLLGPFSKCNGHKESTRVWEHGRAQPRYWGPEAHTARNCDRSPSWDAACVRPFPAPALFGPAECASTGGLPERQSSEGLAPEVSALVNPGWPHSSLLISGPVALRNLQRHVWLEV